MLRRRRSRTRRSLVQWWVLWRVPVLLLVIMTSWWFLYRPYVEASAEWVRVEHEFGICGERGRPIACVSDGDTVTIGYGSTARRIRLTGFDAPEIDGACPAESAEALRAQSALQNWLNRGPLEWDGGSDPPRDRYGRELRRASRVQPDGSRQMLADHMIDTGLAEGPGAWESRNWCS